MKQVADVIMQKAKANGENPFVVLKEFKKELERTRMIRESIVLTPISWTLFSKGFEFKS